MRDKDPFLRYGHLYFSILRLQHDVSLFNILNVICIDMDNSDGIDDDESFMQDKLPPYVVKCFLAAGFDTPDVIASMDTSENPGNSLAIIESFIDKYYSGHKDFYPTSTVPIAQKPFIFPPGHRLRISNFVTEVKRRHERMFEVFKQAQVSKFLQTSVQEN